MICSAEGKLKYWRILENPLTEKPNYTMRQGFIARPMMSETGVLPGTTTAESTKEPARDPARTGLSIDLKEKPRYVMRMSCTSQPKRVYERKPPLERDHSLTRQDAKGKAE